MMETTASMDSLIHSHPFFQGLNPDQVDLISSCASFSTFQAGESIFHEGADAQKCYLILEGHVSLEIFNLEKGSIPVQTLGPGEVIGWSWLVAPYKWRFDGRAQEHTTTISLDGQRLRDLCESSPLLGYELLKRFAVIMEQRLHSTRRQLLENYNFRG